MFAFLHNPFRVLLVAAMMVFVSVSTAQATTTTARDSTYASRPYPTNAGDAEMGVFWIVVGIVVVVFFVWLCAKITDTSHPSDGMMG
ncbi:MAG TPA: hypothetical protein VMZ71_05440 [Gemmataceae bacterium]|nr:hypothetical protein [Gemmataceae bacterium]